MQGKVKYVAYRVRNIVKIALKKAHKYDVKKVSKYAGRKVMQPKEVNDIIYRAILREKPFAAVRYGSSELATTMDAIDIDFGFKKTVRDKCMLSLCRNAGFFPNDKKLAYKYGKIQAKLCVNADLFVVWGMNMEDYVINTFGRTDAYVGLPIGLEPYYHDNPWTQALKGKKVLVIHPFADTIQQQYKNNRTKIFSHLPVEVLPEFELVTLKAVQSAAYSDTEFETWFDALKHMFNKAMEIDFDVAILGCGAYGLPLTCMLKAQGKTAIHMGGATQLLFGIKGKRWENNPYISKLFNEAWVRPASHETPAKAAVIENACYW